MPLGCALGLVQGLTEPSLTRLRQRAHFPLQEGLAQAPHLQQRRNISKPLDARPGPTEVVRVLVERKPQLHDPLVGEEGTNRTVERANKLDVAVTPSPAPVSVPAAAVAMSTDSIEVE